MPAGLAEKPTSGEPLRISASAKNLLWAAIKLILAVGLVGYLIWRGDVAWEPIRASVSRWQFSFLALLVLALTPFGQLWRWQSLLRASRLLLPTREVFSFLMVSKFLNMALPGYIGGDVIRGFYVSRRASEANSANSAEGHSAAWQGASAVLPSIIFDRMAGLLPLFVLSLAGAWGAIWYSLPSQLLLFVGGLSGCGLLAALGTFWLAYRSPDPPLLLLRISARLRLDRLFSALFAGSHQYVRNLPLIRKVLGISFLSQGLILSSFVLFGHALELGIPLISYLVLVPVGLMVTAVPISPAGLGVGQVAFLALFQMAGSSQGANLFTLYMASSALINLSGAVVVPFLRVRTPLPATTNLAQAEKP